MPKSGLAIAGMIMIIISLVFTALGLPVLLFYNSVISSAAELGGIFQIFLDFFAVLIVVQIVGIVFNIFALLSAIRNLYRRAGVLAIIATILPPFNLISLLGGIFCLASKESKK